MRDAQRLSALLLFILLLIPASVGAAPRVPESIVDAAAHNQAEIPGGIQSFLEQRGSVLASYRSGDKSAAEIIEGYTSYYSLDPRVLLTLLELVPGLLTHQQADEALLSRPFGAAGP